MELLIEKDGFVLVVGLLYVKGFVDWWLRFILEFRVRCMVLVLVCNLWCFVRKRNDFFVLEVVCFDCFDNIVIVRIYEFELIRELIEGS